MPTQMWTLLNAVACGESKGYRLSYLNRSKSEAGAAFSGARCCWFELDSARSRTTTWSKTTSKKGNDNSSNAKIPKDLETSPPRRNLARERGGRTRAKERGKASHQREKESGLPQHHLGGGTPQMAIREKGTKVTKA